MNQPHASTAGTFLLGGQLPVNRLGFGAMRVTGEGVWGEHPQRDRCLATLSELTSLGVNFIDTADSYGPTVSEPLLHEALHPYPDDMVIATKGGQVRPEPGKWVPLGRPEYLIQQAKMSLRWLGLERIPLWQLHRIDPNVPRDEQFDAIKQMLDEGLIRFAGLSAVNVEEIQAANKVFPVTSVQNRYSLGWDNDEDVVDYCQKYDIAFIPYAPLSKGGLVMPDSPLIEMARRHNATPAQIAIAWVLKRSPVTLPIPGTSRPEHLAENVAAAGIELSDDELDVLGEITSAT